MSWDWITIEKLLEPGTTFGALALAVFMFVLAWIVCVVTTRLIQRANWVMGKFRRKVDETVTRYVIRIKNLLIFLIAALFYAGLNSVQLHFPDDDYRSAQRYFQQVTEKFPDSPLADQSAVWGAVLSRLQQAKQDVLSTEDKVRRCRQTQDEKDRALVKLKTETEKLKKEIELLKKVDLQIHQQKRDMSNAGKQ